MIFPQCESSYGLQNYYCLRNSYYIGYTDIVLFSVYPHMPFKNIIMLKSHVTLSTLIWFITRVRPWFSVNKGCETTHFEHYKKNSKNC